MRKKVFFLPHTAGDSNFCASLKLFKTWLYPCFIALVMFVPYIWHNLPLLNLLWKNKQNLSQLHHFLNCSTPSFLKIIISFLTALSKTLRNFSRGVSGELDRFI